MKIKQYVSQVDKGVTKLKSLFSNLQNVSDEKERNRITSEIVRTDADVLLFITKNGDVFVISICIRWSWCRQNLQTTQEHGETETKMKTHHEYPARITTDNWLDLLAVQKIDGRSINSLINEGAREVVKKKQMELATYRKVRTTIHTAVRNI